ncbi:unnamed protein product [Rhizoctonia solani]|uniref:Uncharacterized protein n=1 Tax=Rhizoctonia solani TaxID=456999 RepID=A0A8H3DPK0_9AGAM|nr:unnamed protein product [Rhizoctonia solani]
MPDVDLGTQVINLALNLKHGVLSENLIVTRSLDGLIRVQALPNKLSRVIADVQDTLIDFDSDDSNDENHNSSEEEAELGGNINDNSDSVSKQSKNEPAIGWDQNGDGADSDSEPEHQPGPVLSGLG